MSEVQTSSKKRTSRDIGKIQVGWYFKCFLVIKTLKKYRNSIIKYFSRVDYIKSIFTSLRRRHTLLPHALFARYAFSKNAINICRDLCVVRALSVNLRHQSVLISPVMWQIPCRVISGRRIISRYAPRCCCEAAAALSAEIGEVAM